MTDRRMFLKSALGLVALGPAALVAGITTSPVAATLPAQADVVYDIAWFRAASLPDGPILAEMKYRVGGDGAWVKKFLRVIEEPNQTRFVIEGDVELVTAGPWRNEAHRGKPIDEAKRLKDFTSLKPLEDDSQTFFEDFGAHQNATDGWPNYWRV